MSLKSAALNLAAITENAGQAAEAVAVLDGKLKGISSSSAAAAAAVGTLGAAAAQTAPALQDILSALSNIASVVPAQAGFSSPGSFGLGEGLSPITGAGPMGIAALNPQLNSQEVQAAIQKWISIATAVARAGNGSGFAGVVATAVQQLYAGQLSFQAFDAQLHGQLAVFASSFEMESLLSTDPAARDAAKNLYYFIGTGQWSTS